MRIQQKAGWEAFAEFSAPVTDPQQSAFLSGRWCQLRSLIECL